MKSYRPEELFDANGRLIAQLAELAPKGERRMGANPHANGGRLLRDLRLPDFRDYAVKVTRPGAVHAESTRMQGQFIRDVFKLNADARNFRVFSPDETASNRWGAVFEVTKRCSTAEILPGDDHLAPDGRVMEMLSEHQCEGWLEGYLLTGRHGFLSCYEAFIHIVDSMFNQHAKWLERDAGAFHGGGRLLRSITCFPRTCGGRTTMDSAIRTRVSSIIVDEQDCGCGARLSAPRCQHAAGRD